MELQSLKQRFGIIGNAAELNYALSVAQRVAGTNLSVLISGESGVGKENFSKIIHQFSSRKHEKLIAVNTGAIPEGTVDSELFGHKKGAFTGATEDRKGYFETVDGGTIFLDEIGEMPLGTQARLLRVLESGEFIPVGASEVKKTDVRVVAATNVNLLEKVKMGKFREDLYYRLNTVPIYVPPLRTRGQDVLLLFRKFSGDFAEKYKTSPVALTEDAQELVLTYGWPGNIRELKNFAEQLSVLSDQKNIDAQTIKSIIPNAGRSLLPVIPERKEDYAKMDNDLMYKMLIQIKKDMNALKDFVLSALEDGKNFSFQEQVNQLPDNLKTEFKQQPVEFADNANKAIYLSDNEVENEVETVEESLSLDEVEKDYISRALKKHKGKRKDAALDLGISERTLYRKIKEYQLETK